MEIKDQHVGNVFGPICGPMDKIRCAIRVLTDCERIILIVVTFVMCVSWKCIIYVLEKGQ